MNLQTVYTDCR